MPPALQVLERAQPLGDRVYATLRDYLRAGRLATGHPLQEASLAAQLGVSRTPVREALARLASEGLVVAEGRSFTVPSLSDGDIEDIYALRFLLEPQALRLIAESKPARKALAPLRKALEDMAVSHAAGDGALQERALGGSGHRVNLARRRSRCNRQSEVLPVTKSA